uniref:Piwi domain-containing protein n=1 Tax=Panagrellus redivivus TaxID=6233 RepID=A0A7E4UUJ2_PANRE
MSLSDSSSHGGEDSDPPTEAHSSPDARREIYRTAARDLGNPVACEKLKKGETLDDDHQILVKTNIHGVRMNLDPKIIVYQYHVNLMKRHVDNKTGNLVDYPMYNMLGLDTDYFKVNRRRMTTKIFKVLCDTYPVFGHANNFVYDSANTFFTFNELPKDRKIYEIDEDLSTEWLGRKNQIYLEIVNPESPVQFNVKDFSHISRNFKVYNQEVIRFLELATSHYPINHTGEHIMYNNTATYFMDPTRYGYTHQDLRDLGNGKYISIGASKNVLSIEGPTMRAAAALSIDSKKVLYYHTGTLLDIICRLCDIRNPHGTFDSRHFTKIRGFIKKLVCHRAYGDFGNATVVLYDIRPMTADTYTFNAGEGRNPTVQQYLREKYEIELEFPHLPMVCEMMPNKSLSFYPLEVLRIADFQRVGAGTTPDDIREIIRSTAVAPNVKQVEVDRSYKSFNFENNAFMNTMGISIMEKPIVVSARLLTAPSIQYANGTDQPQVNGTWRMNKQALFLRPGVCDGWACVLIESGGQTNFEEFKNFGRMYWAEANRRGLVMPQPLDCLAVASDREALKDVFLSAVNMRCKFLLIGHPDKENTLHSAIKTLERKHDIVTQCVKTSTLSKVAAQRSQLTLENLVMKGNVKMGGLNYSIKLKTMPIDEGVLFLGFGLSAPGAGFGTVTPTDEKKPQKQPDTAADADDIKKRAYSVIGYAANDSEHHDEFTGNFLLQPSYRDDKVVVSQLIFEDVFSRYLKNHNNVAPTRVILYRNGCTEGQFGDVLRYELPHLRTAMKTHFQCSSKNKIPLTVIVPSKVHSVRFFNSTINPQDKAMDQNICPGVVIDSAVTHSAFCEFYLNSHRAIQGTAKTPKYSIIYNDDEDATLDMFERWTNALCYDFQIVNSPTSLPAPAYIANRYAERGRMLLNCYEDTSLRNGQAANSAVVPPVVPAPLPPPPPPPAVNGNGEEPHHEDEDSGSASGSSLHQDLLSQHFYLHSLLINYNERPDLRRRRLNA